MILGERGLHFPFSYCRFKVLVLSRSKLHVQVLFLRRGEIGAPAEKLLKAMTKNTNKLQETYDVARAIMALGC